MANMKRTLARIGLLALAVAALGFTHTYKMVGSDYRWHHEFQVATAPNDTTDVTFRFPKTGNAPASDGPTSRAVNFLKISYSGTTAVDFVVFSPAFLGTKVDTVKITNIFRSYELLGARVDSCRFINGVANERIYIDGAG